MPELADEWKPHDRYWENIDLDQFGATLGGVMQGRNTSSTLEFATLALQVVNTALGRARIRGQDVSYFIPPPGAGSGGIYHRLASISGLPWTPSIQDFYLDHGYLAGAAQAAALIDLCDELHAGATVLMMATEYNVGCTAVILRIQSDPVRQNAGQVNAIR
ncbi:hypothetical protein [Mycobacteroides chelonae]|uniref:hypothetical protein n=1 Tax=Mycobacteroides chelonae TaxID=1774 RepID=UPI0012FFAE87|nr:hypothetical protein [Mycobacteroides chelonae]